MRNSISRNRALGEKLLDLKIEDTLRQIMNQKKSTGGTGGSGGGGGGGGGECHEEAKAVLRDLGCHIELKELWTGSGKVLQQ